MFWCGFDSILLLVEETNYLCVLEIDILTLRANVDAETVACMFEHPLRMLSCSRYSTTPDNYFQFIIARLACLPCKKNDRQVHKRYIAVAQFHCSRDPSSTARCKAKLLMFFIWERTSLKSNPHINDRCLTFLPWGSADVSPKRNGDPSPHFPQEEVDVAPPPENPPRHRPSSSWLDLLLSPPLPGHGESQWLLACEPPSQHHHNQPSPTPQS